MPPKRKARAGASNDGTVDAPGAAKAETIISNTNLLVPTPSALIAQDIEGALSRYSSHIEQLGSKPGSKLRELDDWRLNELLNLVRSRDPAYLDKEELQKLMEWKLTRGKFRPTLPALIDQNTQEKVTSLTQQAFAALSQLKSDSKDKAMTSESQKAFRALLKTLCAGLKGVGPATGSLVLSIFDDRIPFMSDEAYIWAMYADQEASSGKSKLKREVKYTEKGYLDFAVRIWEIAALVGYTPVEVERVGWVLGREWTMGGRLTPTTEQCPNTETLIESAEKTSVDVSGSNRPKRQKR
ncbi:hypothetical protein FRC12_020649 [Ceratobasidium sp. 428]|nr:hypothetical protein FRC12_020649 [Ceratobasidium sp. 428]